MNLPPGDINSFIDSASARSIDLAEMLTYCSAHSISFADLCNEISITVAQRFNSGSMAYQDADAAMNGVWGMMVAEASDHWEKSEFAQPAFAIYEAFDAGEYDHGDGLDPVEAFTKPLIREILRRK